MFRSGADKNPSKEDIANAVKAIHLIYTNSPQPELLIRIPNQYPMQFEEEHATMEFTSLCPFNPGQPNYAKLTIRYLPDKYLVELKSLKTYLASFRMVQMQHEEVAPLIVGILYDLLEPCYVNMLAEFSIRGGIATVTNAKRIRPGWNPEQS
jgi:7-cyano-7-deazaguanine reductase